MSVSNAQSSVRGVGGIVNRFWSKVDISGSGNAGGIVGRAQSNSRMAQLLAVGNVGGQEIYTGRIVGAKVSEGTTLTNAFGYSGQKLNGVVKPEDPMDANGLMSPKQLIDPAYYWNNVNLGYDFRYTDKAEDP